MTDAKDETIEAHRIRSWREFSAAIDAGLRGEWGVVMAYVEANPAGKAEFRAFLKACNTGWLVRGEKGGWRSSQAPRIKAKAQEPANPAKTGLGGV